MSADTQGLDLPAASPESSAQDVLADDVRPTPPPAPVTAPVAAASPVRPAPAKTAQSTRERARGVAVGGSVAEVPQMPDAPIWPTEPVEPYLPSDEIDATDLSQINCELNRCRGRLFQVSQALKIAQRELRDIELLYSRNMRRALIKVSGGTAETRRAVAEMECEPFENDMAVKQQVVEELRKRSLDVRDDLKAVENLSHNARAQMALR